MPNKIIARGVRRSFGTGPAAVHALGPAALTVGDGEFVCIAGPSGCGKSTLLRALAGLVHPTEGEVLIRHREPHRQPLSIVFQEYSIYPWKTVEENVRLGLDIAGVPRREATARVAD